MALRPTVKTMTKAGRSPHQRGSVFFLCGMGGVGGHKCPPAGRRGEQERKKKWRFKKKEMALKKWR